MTGAARSVLTTFTVFHFEGWRRRWWAFRQMATGERLLRGVGGLRFARLMGTGRRFAGVRPDWGRYALVCAWDSERHADDFLRASPFMDLYRARAARLQTTHLRTLRAQGSWDGEAPFGDGTAEPAGGAVAVLTRATLDPRRQLAFWRHANAAEPEVSGAEGLRWALGMGELPVLRSGTFSVWESAEAIAGFLRKSPAHRAAMVTRREQAWYREELFARFAVLRSVEEST